MYLNARPKRPSGSDQFWLMDVVVDPWGRKGGGARAPCALSFGVQFSLFSCNFWGKLAKTLNFAVGTIWRILDPPLRRREVLEGESLVVRNRCRSCWFCLNYSTNSKFCGVTEGRKVNESSGGKPERLQFIRKHTGTWILAFPRDIFAFLYWILRC